jgi:catechol 2,3-dioxygenase-like lactoylglutathione lyase family enzyme
VQIAAPAGCESAARRFYGELLGLRELEKPEPLRARGGAWFELADGRQLHIGVEEDFVPARKAHPALRAGSREVEELAARITAAGGALAWDEALPDVRRFFTEDPWGNRIEVLSCGRVDA